MHDTNIETIHDYINDNLTKGADYCDVYIQQSAAHQFHYDNGRLDELSSAYSGGVGARVIKDGKTFYSHRPGTDALPVSNAIDNVSTSASLRNKKIMLNGSACCDFNERWPKVAQPDIDFMNKIDKEIKKQSQLVKQITFRFTVQGKNVSIFGPSQLNVLDRRNYCTFTANVVVEKDGSYYTGSERRYMSLPEKDFWTPETPMKIAQTAFSRAILMSEAENCPAGKMPVLLAGEAGGTIIHEAVGHGLEADIVNKDKSVYSGRLSKQVASEIVTIVDDAAMSGLYGYYSFDDEGTPAQRTVLIENGVLKSYLTDILSTKLYGYAPTGNGRRESYRNIPVPRMSNTYLLPRENGATVEEMAERAVNGLFVKKMGGGEVDPTSGNFVFYVAEGYIIKNGKIKNAVKGATLIGNGPDALNNISMLGNNLIMDPGVCGKSGQSVPVTDGQPSMLIDGLTVGGRNI